MWKTNINHTKNIINIIQLVDDCIFCSAFCDAHVGFLFAAFVLWCLTILRLPAFVLESFSCHFLVYVGLPFSSVLSDVFLWFHVCSVFLFYACCLAVLFWCMWWFLGFHVWGVFVHACFHFVWFFFDFCMLSVLPCLPFLMFPSLARSSIYTCNKISVWKKNNDINLMLGTSQPKWRSKCTYMVSM